MIRRLLWPVLQRPWQWLTGLGSTPATLVSPIYLEGTWESEIALTGEWSGAIELEGSL